MNYKNLPLKKITVIFTILIVLYTITGFFIAPYIAKKVLIDKLSENLKRDVIIEKVTINPYSLTTSINGFVIKEKSGNTFVSVKRLFANLSLSSIFKFAIVVSEIAVDKPYINIIQYKTDTFNFSDILSDISPNDNSLNSTISDTEDNTASENTPSNKPDNLKTKKLENKKEDQIAIISFILNNLNINEGNFIFEDKVNKTKHTVKDFSLLLSLLNSRPKDKESKTTIKTDFIFNDALFKIELESTPFKKNLATNLRVKASNINILNYIIYAPIPENLAIKSLNTAISFDVDFKKIDDIFSLILKGNTKVTDIDITDINGEQIIKIPSLTVDVLSSDILDNTLTIANIIIEQPEIYLGRDSGGKLNLLKYLPKEIASTNNKKASLKSVKNQKPFNFNLNNFQLNNGSVFFSDASNVKEVKIKLFPVNVALKEFKSNESIFGNYNVSITTDANELIKSSGSFQDTPLKADGHFSIERLLFNKYSPYYEKLVDLEIEDGSLNFDTGFSVAMESANLNAIINLKELSVNSLKINDKRDETKKNSNKLIDIPLFKITDSIINTGKKTVDTGKIQINNGSFFIKRESDGTINILNCLKPLHSTMAKKSNPSIKKTIHDNQKKQSYDKIAKHEKTSSKEEKPSNSSPNNSKANSEKSSWAVNMNSFKAKGLKVDFKDLTNIDPVQINLSDILINAENIKTNGDEKGKISVGIGWNKEGSINIDGTLLLSELSTQLNIDIQKIDIMSLQPYFTEEIKIMVTDGEINNKGKVHIKIGENFDPDIQFTGMTSIVNFKSLGKQKAKDFLKFNTLYLNSIDFSTKPLKLNVKKISLTDFYSRLIMDDDGELNVVKALNLDDKKQEPFKQEPSKQDPPNKELSNANAKKIKSQSTQASASVLDPTHNQPFDPDIHIDMITLQGGKVEFSDYLTKPNFTAHMKAIGGSVTNLSSKNQSKATVLLKGMHGESSPLEITGEINPLADKLYVDLKISFKDIELTKFTPYSSKYLGYEIEKGKLVLDLSYLIDGNKLESKNRLFFDDFTLGNSTDSKDATSLPVGFAISLLKNKDGQIDLDLPVTGKLDDPEFSIGHVILDVIVNLITKAVTSPFSVINAMFGDDVELSFVEYNYGATELEKNQLEKVDKLITVLTEKPDLNLEIEGSYDKLKDAEALRKKNYMDLITAVKINEMVAQGVDIGKNKDIIIPEEEMEKYITLAYEQAEFPKPMDKNGKEKQIELSEKQKLLETSIKITHTDLRLLAMQRAEKIKAYIINNGKIKGEKLFLREPNKTKETGQEKAKNTKFSKVDFFLKS